MTVCGIKHADGVCVMGECPYIKMCCPAFWDKRKSEPMTKEIKIKCDDCKFVEDCVDYGWQECKKFTPKPSEPMTNKEYYTETDEELAGFLSRTCRDLLGSVVEDGGSVPNEYIEEDREFWLKWLKEKHK